MEFVNAGTAEADSLAYLTVVTAGTLSQIVWENTTNGDKVTIPSSFSNGDQIVIVFDKIVAINQKLLIKNKSAVPACKKIKSYLDTVFFPFQEIFLWRNATWCGAWSKHAAAENF